MGDLEGYQCIMASQVLNSTLDSLHMRGCQSRDWAYGVAGGDVVAAHTTSYQDLHSDQWSYPVNMMFWGYSLAISVALHDIDVRGGPIRAVPWDVLNDYSMYPKDVADESPDGSTSILMRKGQILIRDVRVAHGGSPNLLDFDRFLPGLQIFSPSVHDGDTYGCPPNHVRRASAYSKQW